MHDAPSLPSHDVVITPDTQIREEDEQPKKAEQKNIPPKGGKGKDKKVVVVKDKKVIINKVSKATSSAGALPHIRDDLGRKVHLAGASFSMGYSVSSTIPNSNRNHREEMFKNAASAGANLIVIGVNSELWSNKAYKNEVYKKSLDTYVKWAVKYRLYFIIKLQSIRGKDTGSFSGPGSNWKIAASKTKRSNAIKMFTEMAEKYKNNNNFVGFTILNEPYSGSDYSKWNVVTDFYLDVIDAVYPIDKNCAFFVMAPYRYSGYPIHWEKKGHLDRPKANIVYEFHSYYHNRIKREWGPNFASGKIQQGKEDLETWLKENILIQGYPVFCGEFGIIHTDSRAEKNWKEAHLAQMNAFNKYKIHYAQWRLWDDRAKGGRSKTKLAMSTNGGLDLNLKGETWKKGLPKALIRP